MASYYDRTTVKKGLFHDELGLNALGFFSIFGAIVVLLAVVLFCGIVYGGRAYGRGQCQRWGEATGYQSKMVITGWADSGTCLAKTKRGVWVKNTQIRDIAP